MSESQATETETAPIADAASTPVATSEAKGITAVSEALKAVFGDLKTEGATAPAAASGEPASSNAPAGEDDGLSAGELEKLLQGFDETKPEAKTEPKPDDKKADPADPFAKIEENWDSDVAKVMRDQANRIADLEKRLEGAAAPKPTPNALEQHLTATLGPEHKLVRPETVGVFARLVDKTAFPIANALVQARPPQTPEEMAAIEREAINLAVSRITNKPTAAPKLAPPTKTIPPGGNAGTPAAHRSAPTNAENGAAAIARAMAALG